MNRKKAVGRLQNLVLILLTASALFLLTRTPLLGYSWGERFQSLLSAGGQSIGQPQEEDLADLLSSLHLVVTGDRTYGRFGQLYMSTDDPGFQQISPLFRDALGSADVVGATADLTLREALDSPCLYVDLTVELPLAVVAAWLGTESDLDRPVRAMALTTEDAGAAALYLISQDGSIFRCRTALPVSAVSDLADNFSPNSAAFAYESNYATLAPYTVLVASLTEPVDLLAQVPAGYSTYSLLTALDFNAHTNSRYTESSGAEVVVESPRTLRLTSDGTVVYAGDESVTAALYQVPAAGQTPTVPEALNAARHLADALSEGTGGDGLYLTGLEQTEEGFLITFGYRCAGYPVFFSDGAGGAALSLTITGRTITAFRYHCRAYLPQESVTPLLPPAQAIAVASIYPEAQLAVGYEDTGSGTISAQWLAG